ncbi:MULTISPECIES: TIGR03905 family TSCPD domain-containing protein [Parabacteroides]|uniref:TIGR03905 family TSCPD domain-containing protein n=1 Tax=Parabacteroides provencensis TaxID=1944636 RepID=UPI000C150A0C|nr:TIGR03905 family TSCPD domain-containing protein [Parabacteroides provencensis]
MEQQRVVYTPQGDVCSKMMLIDVQGDVITNVQIIGGCHGNAQGISALLVGMNVNEAINRMEGIDCHGRGTSCPDQLAQALKKCI